MFRRTASGASLDKRGIGDRGGLSAHPLNLKERSVTAAARAEVQALIQAAMGRRNTGSSVHAPHLTFSVCDRSRDWTFAGDPHIGVYDARSCWRKASRHAARSEGSTNLSLGGVPMPDRVDRHRRRPHGSTILARRVTTEGRE
jgi:uncharacterized Zn-binding protein involved in type VI secretion